MHLDNDEIHIWSMSLICTAEQAQAYAKLLSTDETARAERFRFPEHRRHFTIARSVLRQILSMYTEIAPEKINFSYGEHGKPALASLTKHLYFNLAHSDDLVVYAIAHQPIGIDIEKIKASYEQGLPERFFSPQECESLKCFTDTKRVSAFYRIWAKKEAIIKASGKGLATSLASFTVSPDNIEEKICFAQETWHLQPLSIDPAFAAALASQHPAKNLLYYNFKDYTIKL